MGELAASFRSLVDRVTDAVNVLDASFLVSGGTCLGALWLLGGEGIQPRLPENRWGQVAIVLLACYVLGLCCFGLGRRAARNLGVRRSGASFAQNMRRVIRQHRLEDDAVVRAYWSDREPSLAGLRLSQRLGKWRGRLWKAMSSGEVPEPADTDPSERLYIRLWAEVRQRDELAPSMRLLQRFWMASATCDGLATAFLVWGVVGMIRLLDTPTLAHALCALLTAILAVVLCSGSLREGARFLDHQVEELVATYAYYRGTRSGDEA